MSSGSFVGKLRDATEQEGWNMNVQLKSLQKWCDAMWCLESYEALTSTGRPNTYCSYIVELFKDVKKCVFLTF